MPVVLAAEIRLAGLTSRVLRVVEVSALSLRTCLAERVIRVGALVVSKASPAVVRASDNRLEPIRAR